MTVKDRITALSDNLTVTERKLSTAILSDYPFAALEPIQALAERTSVSPPSISRFVTKLGFQGFGDLQRHLIEELKEGQRSPLDLHRLRREPRTAYLDEMLRRIGGLLETMSGTVTAAQFDRMVDLLADPGRQVFVAGGRVSDAIAQHLSRHLRQIRPNVFHLPGDPEVWPDYLLKMKPRDLFLVVDFRRYQESVRQLAKQAAERREVYVLLITDKWISPASAYAREVVALPIEIGTAWDSYVGAVALVEALVARVSEIDWDKTRDRLKTWDEMRLTRSEESS